MILCSPQPQPKPWEQPYIYRIVQSRRSPMGQNPVKSSRKIKQDSAKQDDQAPKLLFINKDASNLSRTSAEVYAVGSHVSKGSRKWKRTNSSLELDSSTGRILAAAGLDTPGVSTGTPSPTQGKSITLRWRMNDGRVTSTKMAGVDEKGARRSKAVQSATTSPVSSLPLTPPMPPPSPEPAAIVHGRPLKHLLQFYVDVIRPFALSVSRSWLWADDLRFVVSSPALTYAICAYASAFQTSAERGMHSLVLPPDAGDQQRPLWPIPEWFTFQAQAISLIRRRLADTTDTDRPIQKAELHAMLFLMRLQVLLGDRDAALLHLNAIKKATENAAILPDLHLDIAMWKVNLMVAFTNQSCISMRPYISSDDPAKQMPLLDIDRSKIQDPTQRRRLCAHVINRSIIWRPQPPQELDPQEDLLEDFLTIDPYYNSLDGQTQENLKICLQISRYLCAYLRFLNADTSLDNIGRPVAELRRHISALLLRDPDHNLWQRVPRLMFYVMFTGAYVSGSSNSERAWFARQIGEHFSCNKPNAYDDMKVILSMFLDPATVHETLLRQVWEDILAQQPVR